MTYTEWSTFFNINSVEKVICCYSVIEFKNMKINMYNTLPYKHRTENSNKNEIISERHRKSKIPFLYNNNYFAKNIEHVSY